MTLFPPFLLKIELLNCCNLCNKLINYFLDTLNEFFSNFSVFEEKPHNPEVGDGDASSPSTDIPSQSSISSPTEPTKSTNLEETESSNRSKNDLEISDTRQALLAPEDLYTDFKPSSDKNENQDLTV